MPPISSSQKLLVAQFVTLTGVPEKSAAKLLRSAGWKLDQACDSEFLRRASAWRLIEKSAQSYRGVRSVYKIGDIADAGQRLTRELVFGVTCPSSLPDIRYIIADMPTYRPLEMCSTVSDSPAAGIKPVPRLRSAVLGDDLALAIFEAESTNGYELPSYTKLQKHVEATGACEDALRTQSTDPIATAWISPSDATRFEIGSGHKSRDETDYLNSFFQSGGQGAGSKESTALAKLFEDYRDGKNDEADIIGVAGTMQYFEQLGINLESVEFLVPMEIIQAPVLGEIGKEGFVTGWKKVGADTIPKQKAYIADQIQALKSDMALFKRVYRYTFVCTREKGQKALPLDNALVYWGLLFNPPGIRWVTSSTNWIELWSEFLTAKWTKSVNRDMWNQTFEFFSKTMQDETLSFWSEDGAWPGVIDDFVAYAKEKRGDVLESMETD